MAHVPSLVTRQGSAYVTDAGADVPAHNLFCYRCSCGWSGRAYFASIDAAHAVYRRHADTTTTPGGTNGR